MQFIKKVPYRKIHNHQVYKTDGLAKLLGVCHTTIWNWLKKGLPVVNPSESPPYYLGKEVKAFLADLLQSQKKPLEVNEFLCTKCHNRVLPVPESIHIKPLGDCIEIKDVVMFQIKAKCKECGSTIHKITHRNKLPKFIEPHGLRVSDLMNTN